MTTLLLRCIRCGDWATMEPAMHWSLGLCVSCELKAPLHGEWPELFRWLERWRKNEGRHPTYKALTAALDAMERMEPAHVLRRVAPGVPSTSHQRSAAAAAEKKASKLRAQLTHAPKYEER